MEKPRGPPLLQELQERRQWCQEHHKEYHIVCITELRESGVIVDTQSRTANNCIGEPVVNCNVEKFVVGTQPWRTPDVVRKGSDSFQQVLSKWCYSIGSGQWRCTKKGKQCQDINNKAFVEVGARRRY